MTDSRAAFLAEVPKTSVRLGARIVDAFVIFALWLPAFGGGLYEVMMSDRLWMNWAYLVYFVSVPFFYEGLCLWFFGATLGKWVFFLKVVPFRQVERPLNISESFTRSLAFQLSFFFSYAVQAFAFFRYDRTHLADWIAGTRVISMKHRRALPVRLHWVIGSVLILFFAWEGWRSAHDRLNSLAIDRAGVTFETE